MKLLDMHDIGNIWFNVNNRTINFKYFTGQFAGEHRVPVDVIMRIKLSYNKGNFQFTLPQGDPDFNKIVFSLVHYNRLIQSQYNPWTFILNDGDSQSIINGMRNIGIEEERSYNNQWTKDE